MWTINVKVPFNALSRRNPEQPSEIEKACYYERDELAPELLLSA
jgi:hypothetical protein